jgi:hypothetical protein
LEEAIAHDQGKLDLPLENRGSKNLDGKNVKLSKRTHKTAKASGA